MREPELHEMTLFSDALNCSSRDEQVAYVARECAGNPELHARIEALLEGHREAGAFLDGSNSTSSYNDPLKPEVPGTNIGPYKLLEQIGEGGFGIVFMAEQHQPVRRKVALKVIKPGMDTRQVVARFEAEQQALALMDHPNIAHVFDGGVTASGRPYFVMELVRGVPITEFCDQNQVPVHERLELFTSVCQAVQHAHQKGIIHRDLKPSNVLVTLHDEKSVVKIIDFGIAKAIGHQLTEKTLFTNFAQMIGTPCYMSPEQAQMNGLDVDTRSDIYSLGVLLYELLTGMTPIDTEQLRKAAFDEMRRMIREDDPATPSARMSTMGAVGATVSAKCRSDPERLSQMFRSELDWIVMKALEKDRNRRYETAKDFAADVHRYLVDEPVLACPPSASYRMRKLFRRHKKMVLAGLLVSLALLGGIIGTTLGLLRATDAEGKAVNEANQKTKALTEKEASLDFAKDKLFQALVNQARAERGSGRIGQRFETLKAIRAASQIRLTPELRTEAIAALVLPDAEVAQEWERSAGLIGNLSFDALFQQYARADKEGGAAVCRPKDGVEEVILRLHGPDNALCYRVLMSADARFVALGHGPTNSPDGKVRVWKLDGLKPTILVNDESPGINDAALAFHPKSRQLAIGHSDQSVSVYDMDTGKRIWRLRVNTAPFHLAFHPTDYRLAVACGNTVHIFDTDTGKELTSLHHQNPDTIITSLSWHHDGRRLAAGCNDRMIHIWDTLNATEVMNPWMGHSADELNVSFNRAGDRLLSTDWSGLARLWDAAAGKTMLTLPGFKPEFSSNDSLFGPHYGTNKISLWRLAGGQELRVLRPRSANVQDNIVSPVIHPDGRVLAAASKNELCFFDLLNGEEMTSVPLPLTNAARPVFFDSFRSPQTGKDRSSDAEKEQPEGWMTAGRSGLYLWPARRDSNHPELMRIGPPRIITPNQESGFSIGTSASSDGRVVAIPQGHSTLVLYRDRPNRHVVLGTQLRRAAMLGQSGRSMDCHL